MPTSTTLTLFILALCGALLLAIAPAQPAAHGSPPDPPDWYSDGDLQEAARLGDVLYISGDFHQLSATPDFTNPVVRHRMAAFDVRTGGLLDWKPPATLTSVKVLEAGPDRIYIVGTFSDRPGTELHALDPVNNTVTSWAVPALRTDTIYDIAFHKGQIIFPGDDRNFPEKNLLALDTTSGQVTQWADLMNGVSLQVESMIVHGDRLYIGGEFEIYRPHTDLDPIPDPQVNLASFDLATGKLTDWLPIVGPTTLPHNQRMVFDLAAYGDILYISGRFTEIDGQPRAGLAAFSTQTGQLSAWNQQIVSEGWWLAVDQHRLVAWTLSDGSVIRVFHPTTGAPLDWSLAMSWPIGLHMAGDLLFAYGTGQSTQDPELIIAPLPAAPAPPTPTPTATAAPAEARARVYLPAVE